MAQPKFRTGSAAQKLAAKGKEVTPALPKEVKNGDIVVVTIVCISKEAGVLPTVTTPSGWTALGEHGTCEQTAEQRTSWTFAREYQSGTWTTMPAFVANVASTGSGMDAYSFAVENGTLTGVVVTNWNLKVGSTTTAKLPAATSTHEESLAIGLTSSPTTVKEPQAGWELLPEGINTPGQAALVKTAALGNGESTGEATYKRQGEAETLGQMIIIAPLVEKGGGNREDSATLKIAEATARAGGSPRATADTLKITESESAAKAGAASDPISVAETTARAAHSIREDPEEGRFEEATARVAGFPRAKADPVSVAETTKVISGNGPTSSESIAVAETTIRVLTVTRAEAEPLNVLERAQRALVVARATADTLTVGEAETAILHALERVVIMIVSRVGVRIKIRST